MAKRVYLSMAMIGHEEQMDRSKIFKDLLRDAGFDVFDPYEVDIIGWEDGQIVANDLYEVLRSDVLVADLTRPSYGGGTFGELYCAATKKIPSLVIIPDERCGPWLRTFTTTQATLLFSVHTIWCYCHFSINRVFCILQHQKSRTKPGLGRTFEGNSTSTGYSNFVLTCMG